MFQCRPSMLLWVISRAACGPHSKLSSYTRATPGIVRSQRATRNINSTRFGIYKWTKIIIKGFMIENNQDEGRTAFLERHLVCRCAEKVRGWEEFQEIEGDGEWRRKKRSFVTSHLPPLLVFATRKCCTYIWRNCTPCLLVLPLTLILSTCGIYTRTFYLCEFYQERVILAL